jgi:hypothetical protein
MKIVRTVFEKDYCVCCKKETSHKYYELTDARRFCECLDCGEITITGNVEALS